MKYNLVIVFDCGRWQLNNDVEGERWQVSFEREEQVLVFIKMLTEVS
tara:strand:- start:250 stop:390 length:141 start_codon:yes stop_codon:yes gene_type:complete